MDTIGAMIVIVKTLMAHGGNNMIKRKVTYKEPAEYFTPEMRKVAEEWDREHATEKEDKEIRKKVQIKCRIQVGWVMDTMFEKMVSTRNWPWVCIVKEKEKVWIH